MKLHIEDDYKRPSNAIKDLMKKIQNYLEQNLHFTKDDYKLYNNKQFIVLEINGNTYRFIIGETEVHSETKKEVLNSSCLDSYYDNLTYFYDSRDNKHYLLLNGEKFCEILRVRMSVDPNNKRYNRTLYSNELENLITLDSTNFFDVMNAITKSQKK